MKWKRIRAQETGNVVMWLESGNWTSSLVRDEVKPEIRVSNYKTHETFAVGLSPGREKEMTQSRMEFISERWIKRNRMFNSFKGRKGR